MGNIKYQGKDGTYKVVATNSATGITVNDPKLKGENNENNSVEDVLLAQQNEIDTLKGNVSWLAKNGGGGNGGSGGGGGGGTTPPAISEATCEILVNGNASGSKTILNKSGFTIFFKDISVQADKNWQVNITINGFQIAVRQVNRTNNTIILAYEDIVKLPNGDNTLTNHAGTMTITASYEDDINSIYGSAYWSSEILEAVIELKVENVQVNLNDSGAPAEDKSINIDYSVGLTGAYVLNIQANYQGQLTNITENIIINNTSETRYTVPISRLITNINPGEYLITTTLSKTDDTTVRAEYTSTVNFISKNLIISSAVLSKDRNKPIEVSLSASLNAIWSCFGQNISTFTYDYIINDNITVVSGKQGNIGVTINDFIPLIGVSWATENAVISFKIRAYAGDKSAEQVFYFKFVAATGTFIDHHEDTISHQLLDFKAYIYPTDTKSFTINNPSYSTGGTPVGATTKLNLINSSNLTGIKSQASVPPYLRLSNGTYANLEDYTIGTNKYSIRNVIQNSNYQYSVNVCFKADYHSDDDRTILSIAAINNEGVARDGVEINVHNVLINGISVLELIDDEYNDVTVTITRSEDPYINNEGQQITQSKWVCKVYLEGVLSAISIFQSSSSIVNEQTRGFYIGGKPNPAGGTEGIYLCDVNIYSLSFYDYVLNEEDILVNYINNKVLHTYNSLGSFDFNIITEEARKSFCEINETNHITSQIYSRSSDRFNIDFIMKNNKLDQDKINSYAKILGIPIVFIDVSNVAQWTFNNFILQQSAGNVSLNPAVGQKMQYVDPNAQNSLICDINDITVELQGTSTLADAVKNINITLPNTKEDTTVFIPKPTWLPESTYTLKADVVDSSHSNNAAIGKFINEAIGSYFPYSPDAQANIDESNYCKTQQTSATLKHTVEGFPVLLIMKFRTENVGDISITPLGIYNFNLGRNAYRNLGFRKINSIKKDGANISVTAFPYVAEHTVVDEEDSEANWIEVKDTYSVPDLSRVTGDSIPSTFNTSTGDFWQPANGILDLLYEVRYGSRPNPSDYSNFKDFVQYIASLPFEAPIKVIDRVGTKNISQISGEYDAYDYINGQYVKLNEKISIRTDVNEYASPPFSHEALYKYFVIANLFGLVDNFGKNSTYRSWNNGLYYVGFYDMDTALGGDNQGELTIGPDAWIKYFKNNILSGKRYGWLEESYNSSDGNPQIGINGDVNVIGGGQISARANKIWLSIDTNVAREVFNVNTENNNPVESRYAYWWQHLTDELHNRAKVKGYATFADWFIKEYYEAQCGSCGPLLFNLDYRLKYLLQFTNNKYNNLRYTSKLHGRKAAYTKYWLNNRVTFLDSLFAFKRTTETYNRPNDYNSSASINYYDTPDTAPVRFSTPLIFNFKVGDASKSFYFAPKNTKVYVDAGSNSSGSVLTGSINNTPQLLQIGDETITLASLNVNLMGKSENNHALNEQGFSRFVALNLANDKKLGNFTLDAFQNSLSVRPSELREINFENTEHINGSQFELVLYNQETSSSDTKFSKLRSINIANSKCISRLFIPAVPLRELKIINSRLTELNLVNQNYLESVDITGCNQINKVVIQNCSIYKSFAIDSNPNLRTVSITDNEAITSVRITNCNALSNVIIQNCPNLTSIVITPRSENGAIYGLTGENGSGLTLYNLPKLTSLTLTTWPLRTFTMANCNEANMTTLNLSWLGIRNITGSNRTTTISYEGNTEHFLDLKLFKKADINLYGCGQIQHVHFANDKDNPIIYTKSFVNCLNLKRIYGNIVIANPYYGNGSSINGCFYGLQKFSLHGKGNAGKGAGTWKGKTYLNGNTVATPWEIIANIPAAQFNSIDLDFSSFDNITIDDFFQSGNNVTNIRFNNPKSTAQGATNFTHFMRGCSYSIFDLYYVIAVMTLTASQTATANSLNTAYMFYERYLDTGYTNLSTTVPINRCIFYKWKWNLNNLRISTNTIRLPYPKCHLDTNGNLVIDKDNGIFSPCTEMTNLNILFTGSCIITNSLFRRNTGNYKITNIANMYFGNTTDYQDARAYNDYTDFFANLPALATIDRSFNNVIVNCDTLVFPTTFTKIVKAFRGNFSGTFVMSKVFPGAGLNAIISSFFNNAGTKGGTLKLTSDMFTKYTNLEYLADCNDNVGGTYDFNLNYFNWSSFDKVIDQDTFPYDIVATNTKLLGVSGLFYNTVEKEFTTPVKLPGEMFNNTPKLINVSYMFSNMAVDYSLTANGFTKCTNLKYARHLFSQNVTKTYRKGPIGEVPFRLMFHGETTVNKTIETITAAQYNTIKTQIETPVQIPASGDNPASTRPKNENEIHEEITTFLTANSVKTNVTYVNPNATIEDFQYAFAGCVRLTQYTNELKQNPFINNPNKQGAVGQYYVNPSKGSKIKLSDLIEVSQEQAYNRIMIGEIGNFDNDPFKSQATVNDKYTLPANRKINNNTSSLFPNKNAILEYAVPKDLFRYCKSNCNIVGMFYSNGLGIDAGEFANKNTTELRHSLGIRGTIPAELLEPVSACTDLSWFFASCSALSTYLDKDNNVRLLDETFFTYAPNITKFTKTFSFTYLDANINFVNVFNPLKQALNLLATFAAVAFNNSSTTPTVKNVFVNNKLSKIDGCFSANGLRVTTNSNGTESIATWEFSECSNTARYESNFTRANLPVSYSYVYFKQGTANVSDVISGTTNNNVTNP